MLVKEKKYKDDDLCFDSRHELENSNNFIILDDKTSKIDDNVREVLKLIETYGYNVDVVDINSMAKIIINNVENSNIQFDAILTVGTGGLQVYRQISESDIFKNKIIYNIKWNRAWEKDKSIGFETDIENYDIKDKKIIILEDVIASGNTLWTLKDLLELYNNKIEMIYSILIQESSPLLNKSFSNTFSSMMICKPSNEKLDVFWYPPIYSLRHLLFGDDEMPSFYDTLGEKYFNNENKVEKLIKRIRR